MLTSLYCMKSFSMNYIQHFYLIHFTYLAIWWKEVLSFNPSYTQIPTQNKVKTSQLSSVAIFVGIMMMMMEAPVHQFAKYNIVWDVIIVHVEVAFVCVCIFWSDWIMQHLHYSIILFCIVLKKYCFSLVRYGLLSTGQQQLAYICVFCWTKCFFSYFFIPNRTW